MNPSFRRCLEQNKVYAYKGIEHVASKEIDAAESDLHDAERCHEMGMHKLAITQAYYAMFHAGRALLYSQGYKERSHYCLVVALEALYVESGKLSRKSVTMLRRARELRESADYQLEFSGDTARILLKEARDFVEESKEVLASNSRRSLAA